MNVIVITFLLLSVVYYQLKSMQLHRGILEENYTYKEVFWRNFFRINKANMFLVPPESIIKQESYLQDIETGFSSGAKTETTSHSSNHSILLDKDSPFGAFEDIKFPELFKQDGIRKIRISFWCNFKGDIKETHIYLQLLDKDKKVVISTPFYINEDFMMKDSWDFKEFGYQIGSEDLIGKKPVEYINWFIWNNQSKGQVFIDDLKTEFILTNKKFETLK